MLHILEEIQHDSEIIADEPMSLRKISSSSPVAFQATNNYEPDYTIRLEHIILADKLPYPIPRRLLKLPLPFDVPKGGKLEVELPVQFGTAFDANDLTMHWEKGNYPHILDIPYFLVGKKRLDGDDIYERDIEIFIDIPLGRVFIPVLNYGKKAYWTAAYPTGIWDWNSFICGELVQMIDYRGERIGETWIEAGQLFNWDYLYRYYASETWREKLIIKSHIVPNTQWSTVVYYFVILGILASEDTYAEYLNASKLATIPDR